MADRSIIPRDIEGFNNYINQTNDYLILGSPTNAVRFGWTAQNLLDWQDFRTEWNELYFQYSNRKVSYTTAIKDGLESIIAKAILYDWDNKLTLKIKATVGLSSIDCNTFRIPVYYSMPLINKVQATKSRDTNKTSMTEELVYPKFIPIGGGFVKIECFLESGGSGRAHKPVGYDLLEYKVAVFYSGTADIPRQINDTRLSQAYSSKATFILDTTVFKSNLPVVAECTPEPATMAVFFFRWAKSKHPNLDGPWSGPFNTVLL
jgi:hypothetical protein